MTIGMRFRGLTTKVRTIAIRILAVIIVTWVVWILSSNAIVNYEHPAVRGEFGKICYFVGSEHKNIKKPLYFDSIELCQESLSN